MAAKKWIKCRHRVIMNIARVILGPITRIKYHVKIEKFKESRKRQFLVLFNHQTAFDQFFLGLSFSGPLYFLATEDIFSIGFVSKLLRFAAAPIPIKKQTTDLNAIKTLLRVAGEGGSIFLSPEGQRTYSGETTYINPAIVSMAKKLNLPIAIYRIEGGYGTQPRWSTVVRKGPMKAGVSRVIEPEEYADLSKEDFAKLIEKELYVNEACVDDVFKSKHLAEYLERCIYTCPKCGLAKWESKGDLITCTKCGMQVRYKETKELEGVNVDFPHRFVLDWYKAQEKCVNSIDLTEMVKKPVFVDSADFSRVIVYKKKELIWPCAKIELFGDRIEISNDENEVELFPFGSVKAVTVLGKNKVNIYRDKEIFQLKGDDRFNALKYVNFYHRYKNISEGNGDDEFLGL